tara:strand:+ start:539 stop:1780 length:1242 start_codon:yes stop_codon:yes gene_type:complete
MALPLIVTGALGVANKALNAYLIAELANFLTGGFIGNFINRRVFGKTTEVNRDNLGLNNRIRNMRDGAPSQGGALRFLGGRDKRLDDAPDIVPTNQSVLDDIASSQGLALGNTIVPNIDNTDVTQGGLEGVRQEIDKINKNLEAIGSAMLASSGIESAYRKELIDDLENSLAKKGKTRSQTRTQRAISNLISKQQTKIQNKTGNLSKDLANALLLSIGLEAAAGLLGDEGGEDDIPEDDNILFGQDLVDKYGYSDDFNPEDVENNFPVVNDASTPENYIEGLEDDISILGADTYGQSPDAGVVVNSERLTEKQKFERRQQIIRDKKNTLDLSSSIVNTPDLVASNVNISPNNITSAPLESTSGSTQIIDLRTAKEIASSDTDPSSSSSQLDSAIIELDPQRRFSPYEGFVRSV